MHCNLLQLLLHTNGATHDISTQNDIRAHEASGAALSTSHAPRMLFAASEMLAHVLFALLFAPLRAHHIGQLLAQPLAHAAPQGTDEISAHQERDARTARPGRLRALAPHGHHHQRLAFPAAAIFTDGNIAASATINYL